MSQMSWFVSRPRSPNPCAGKRAWGKDSCFDKSFSWSGAASLQAVLKTEYYTVSVAMLQANRNYNYDRINL